MNWILLSENPDSFANNLNSPWLSHNKRLLEEALSLAKITSGSQVVRHKADRPFDDVYHAALNIALRSAGQLDAPWGPSPEPDPRRMFRGQRKDWPLVPNLFRVRGFKGKTRKPNKNEIRADLTNLRDAVKTLQGHNSTLTEDQAVALLQHYYTDAGVRTWILVGILLWLFSLRLLGRPNMLTRGISELLIDGVGRNEIV